MQKLLPLFKEYLKVLPVKSFTENKIVYGFL